MFKGMQSQCWNSDSIIRSMYNNTKSRSDTKQIYVHDRV